MEKRRKRTILAAGALIMLCAGVLYLWSVFQPYMIEFHGSNSGRVSMTSSIMIACFVFGNIAAGLVQQKLHPRIIAVLGSVMFAAGFCFTGFVKPGSISMLYVSYGVVCGLGCGLVYSAVLAVMQKWYAAHTGFITGICVGFFGLSVVVLSPIAKALLNGYGIAFTFKAMAIAFFIILTAASVFLKNPSKDYYYAEVTKKIKPENVLQFTPKQVLKSPAYYYIFIATVTSSAAYMVIVPFVMTIAVSRGMSDSTALYAVMSTGIANAAGRITAPIVSEKIGRTRTLILCSVLSAIGCALIIKATGVYYFAAVFMIAFSFGGTGGVNPVVTTELWGARHSGANYGLVLLSIAVSSILFGKITALLNAGEDFTMIFIICTILCAVPILMMLLLRRRCKRLGKQI